MGIELVLASIAVALMMAVSAAPALAADNLENLSAMASVMHGGLPYHLGVGKLDGALALTVGWQAQDALWQGNATKFAPNGRPLSPMIDLASRFCYRSISESISRSGSG